MKRRAIFLILAVLFFASATEGEQSPPPAVDPNWTGWQIGEVVVRALASQGDDIWIGTSNGLIRFNRKTEGHEVFNTRAGLLSNIIVSIHPDPAGGVWLGTYGGGLTRFDGKNWELFTPYGRGNKRYGADWVHYNPKNGLGDLWVYDLLFEPNGTMWVATWKGASRFHQNGFTTYTMDDGLVDKWVYTIEREPSGVLWFGTEGGINRFDGKTWKGWTHRDGLGADTREKSAAPPAAAPYDEGSEHHQQTGRENQELNPNYVISSAIDAKGFKWFGTWGGGLSRFDGKQFKNYTTADGLPGNIINAVEIDSKGIMWIGTNKGVSRFDGKTFKNFNSTNGLLGDYVYSIAIDPEGNKWFGTFGGVSRYAGP
ncbi:MAG TPA: two-component regulator propeller domain-containing protein [Candidatus Manganitrophaceae bacterium]|nr:two-component regulator propeller domain-containing protein [Candidatus Manganitrophaceae bacterium]